MALSRNFTGFEQGSQGTNSSANTIGNGTARTGDFYYRVGYESSANFALDYLAQVSTSGLAAGDSARAVLRCGFRLTRYPSLDGVIMGTGTRPGVNNTGNSMWVDTNGRFWSRFGWVPDVAPLSTDPLDLNRWYLAEVVIDVTRGNPTPHSFTHSVTVYDEDGNVVFSSSSSGTWASSWLTAIGPVFIGSGNVSAHSFGVDYDDLFASIGTTAADAALAVFPNGTRVSMVMATGQGASADFSGSYQDIAHIPNSTFYNEVVTAQSASTNGATTTYTHKTAAQLGIGNIDAVRVFANAKAASGGVDAVLWDGVEEAITLTTAYQTFESNVPSGYYGTAMTPAQFDAAEFGVRNKRGVNIDIEQCFVQVMHDGAGADTLPAAEGSWRHKCGVFTGNGGYQEISVGFRPTVVLIKKAVQAGSSYLGTLWTSEWVRSSMVINQSVTSGPQGMGLGVMGVTEDGFLLGPNPNANDSGREFAYIAIRDAGEHPDGAFLKTGMYVGNGIDNRDIEIEPGFQPDLLLIGGHGATVWRDRDHVGDESMCLGTLSDASNLVQAFNADGFQIGTSTRVNTLGNRYTYVAIRRLNDLLDEGYAQGIFTAAGASHTVTGLPLEPFFVVADKPAITDGGWRMATAAAHTALASSVWSTFNVNNLNITALTADGFSAGSNLSASGQTTRFMAFTEALEIPWVFGEIEFSEGGLVDIGLTWVEVTDKLDTLRVHSKIALPDPEDYYGGFKDDRVIQWGRVTRALSDRLGQYESAQFTWLQADTDRLYRGLADNEFTKVLKNRPATLRMIDDPSRRLQLTPRTMMKGLIREYKPVAPLQWQWTMRDILAAKFSSENTTDQLPARLITRADFPDCPTNAINQPVPIIYGFMADAASTTAPPVITGTAALGAYTEGGYWIAGYGPLTSAADVPTGVVVALAGGGTLSPDVQNGEYGVIVSSVDVAGLESDPVTYYYNGPNGGRGRFSDGPMDAAGQVVSPDGTEKIQVSWSAAAGADKYRVYLSTYYYGARHLQFIEVTAPTVSCEFTANPAWGDPTTPDNITPGASLTNFGQFWYYTVSALMPDGETAQSVTVFGSSGPYRRPIRIEWLPVTGATGYKVYRRGASGTWDRVWTISSAVTLFDDDLLDTGVTYIDGAPAPTGQVPVIPVGSMVDSGAFTWFAFLVAGHAVKEITDVFKDGVRVDPGNFGVTWAVPGQAGYSTYFPNTGTCQYLDINGRRYTLLFVRGPDGDAAANGTSTITVNIRGIETVGDSSGDLITDGLDQYLHVVKNWVLQTYQSGAWLDAPVFADDPDLAQVDEDSFTAAAAVAASRISGGYVGAWMLGAKGERISIRDMVARLNISFDVDSGFNHKTQFFVSMVDDSLAALTAATGILDVRDIFAESFNVEPVDSEQFNRIPYVYSRDYAGVRTSGNGWNATSELTDATSITDLGETKSSPQIELHAVRAPGQAQDVIYRRLLRSKEPPLRVTWDMGMAGLSVELGDIKLLTHFGGIGASGYVARPVRIIRHETDPEKYLVSLEAFDMQRLFEGTLILGDTATLPADWGSATTVQRRYGYLCDATTGLFGDGSRGKRLR